jgi:triosephosphate isomerase (TIM)
MSTESRTPIVAGNWKMNLSREEAVALARTVASGSKGMQAVDRILFPAAVHLDAVRYALAEIGTGGVQLGAQNAWHEPDGAFTGEVSVAMIKDLGCGWLLTGHSERRQVIGETDAMVNAKTKAGLDAGLQVILCIGETLEQRESGQTDAVNERQLKAGLEGITHDALHRLVIAYEPVWAIGTGKTATPDDAQAAHHAARTVLEDLFGQQPATDMRILYGGSVKPDNAADLFAQPDIDGGLIGGASLKAESFLAICNAAG